MTIPAGAITREELIARLHQRIAEVGDARELCRSAGISDFDLPFAMADIRAAVFLGAQVSIRPWIARAIGYQPMTVYRPMTVYVPVEKPDAAE